MENNWDGTERRKETRGEGFCSAHIDLVSDLAVIKNSLHNIEKTITQSITFKTGVIISMIGVTVALIIQIVCFAYLYGQLNKQVEINTIRLDRIELLK